MATSVSKTLKTFLKIMGGVLMTGMIVSLAAKAHLALIALILFWMLANGWALYCFLRYRQGRQEEIVRVLASAVEANLPLAAAVESFRRDRFRLGTFRYAVIFTSFLILPIYGYIRLWLGWRPYEWLLNDFSARLSEGNTLTVAMDCVPGIVSRHARQLIEVGEDTNSLGACLNTIDREEHTSTWVELAPRIIYPFVVLSFAWGLATYLIVSVVPKYKKIFVETGHGGIPAATAQFIEAGEWFCGVIHYNWIAVYFKIWWFLCDVISGDQQPDFSEKDLYDFVPGVLVMLFIAAIIALPLLRWYTPLIGQLYRWDIQARVLRALGRYIAVGRTIPESLVAISESRALPKMIRKRLVAASAAVEAGEPFPEVLREKGLLPASMVPLVVAAGKANTLPWTFAALGDHLLARSFRLVRRVTAVLSPIAIVCIGAFVAFVALAMFMPMIELLNQLSE